MDQNQLADLLGVSTDTLKYWRSSRCTNPDLKLMPIPSAPRTPSRYSKQSILEWLERNPSYAQRVLALLPQQPVGPGLLAPMEQHP